jgi:hypothetical protein
MGTDEQLFDEFLASPSQMNEWSGGRFGKLKVPSLSKDDSPPCVRGRGRPRSKTSLIRQSSASVHSVPFVVRLNCVF